MRPPPRRPVLSRRRDGRAARPGRRSTWTPSPPTWPPSAGDRRPGVVRRGQGRRLRPWCGPGGRGGPRRRRILAGRGHGRRGRGAAGRRHRRPHPGAVRAVAPAELDDVVALGLHPTVYPAEGIDGVAEQWPGPAPPAGVHLKIDTGMHRVGADPADAAGPRPAIAGRPELVLEAVWTHCAVADEPENPFTLRPGRALRGRARRAALARRPVPMVHAANSAATLDHPRLRHDLVRCGITVYGLDPSPASGAASTCAPRSGPQGPRHPGQGGARRRGRFLRLAPPEHDRLGRGHRAPRLRRRRPRRLSAVGRGAGGRPAPPDGRNRHHGPAPGRLRTGERSRRPRGAVGRRGGAARRAGWRAHRRRGVGRPPRHHRLRGGVRHLAVPSRYVRSAGTV